MVQQYAVCNRVPTSLTIGNTCKNNSGNRFNVCVHGNNDVLYKLTVILMPEYDTLEPELVILGIFSVALQPTKYPKLTFCTPFRGLLGKDIHAKMFWSHKSLLDVNIL